MIWLAVAGVAVGIMPARAIQPSDVLAYSIGPLLVRPQFDITETFDSNLYYRHDDEIGDFITAISPGINLYLGKPEHHSISFNYQLDRLIHADQSRLDGNNHTFTIQTHLQGPHWSLTGLDKILLLSNRPLGAELNFVQGIVDYNVYANNYRLTYNLSEKTSVYLDGAYDAADYAQGTSVLDYNNFIATAGFAYAALPKTTFFGEIYYGQTATDPNVPTTPKSAHSDFVGGFLGAKGDFTTKLSGVMKAGYESRKFADVASADGNFVIAGSLDYRFSEKSAASLNAVRRSGVSVQSGNAGYILDSISIQIKQGIGSRGKWVAGLAAAYDVYNYEGNVFANRTDKLYRVSAGLDYLVQVWLTAGVGYEFSRFDSTSSSVSDYDVHRITVRLAVGY
ncbi:MAG: outer membrane beta-barrel protein [Verrucomicrobiota bacterium]